MIWGSESWERREGSAGSDLCMPVSKLVVQFDLVSLYQLCWSSCPAVVSHPSSAPLGGPYYCSHLWWWPDLRYQAELGRLELRSRPCPRPVMRWGGDLSSFGAEEMSPLWSHCSKTCLKMLGQTPLWQRTRIWCNVGLQDALDSHPDLAVTWLGGCTCCWVLWMKAQKNTMQNISS